MRIPITLFILVIQLSIHLQGFTQSRYKYTKRGNRLEGVKAIGVSAPDLELLSFTGFRENIPAKSDVNLHIRFFLKNDSKLFITAKELIPRKFYIMRPVTVDWLRGWQEFYPWPTGDVLKPLGVNFEEMGIIARLDNNRTGSGNIAPLLIYHSKPGSRIDAYTLHLKPKETLSRVTYTLVKAGSRKAIKSETLRKTMFAREPFSITLDLSGQPAGHYQLILKCRVKNKISGPKRTYSFYHNPLPK